MARRLSPGLPACCGPSAASQPRRGGDERSRGKGAVGCVREELGKVVSRNAAGTPLPRAPQRQPVAVSEAGGGLGAFPGARQRLM